MKSRTFFRNLTFTVLLLNIFIGIGALFLLERIVPAIDSILRQNVASVSSTLTMLSALSSAPHAESGLNSEKVFWEAFEKIDAKAALEPEKKLLDDIRRKAEAYWAKPEPSLNHGDLSAQISTLAELKLQTMALKKDQARRLSLSGSWALGLLLILSVCIQLFMRARIIENLIEPIEQLHRVLNSFSLGRRMRRFSVHNAMVTEIKKIGVLVNDLLDRHIKAIKPESGDDKNPH